LEDSNGVTGGIYLRVLLRAIWIIAEWMASAQVGSRWFVSNNQKHESKPLHGADNPIVSGIPLENKMVGEQYRTFKMVSWFTDNVVFRKLLGRKQLFLLKEAH